MKTAFVAPSALAQLPLSMGQLGTVLVTTVFADADGALAENQALGTNSAALVRVNNSPVLGIYLVVNVTGLKGTLPTFGSIPVHNFFI